MTKEYCLRCNGELVHEGNGKWYCLPCNRTYNIFYSEETIEVPTKESNSMTKEEFEVTYCFRSDIDMDYYHEHYITLPCNCDQPGCNGWAAVNNNPLSIKAHNELYE